MSIRKIWHAVRGWWGGIFLVAFFTYTHFAGKDFNKKLRQEHRYTVGEVYGTHWTPKAGKFADARFWVEGKKYLVSADADALAGQELVGKRFLVEYHPPDPLHYNIMYLDSPAPDSIVAPGKAWATPPFHVTQEVLTLGEE